VSSSIAGRVYPISSFQIFEASLIRGYNSPGRRPIAQPIKSLGAVNTPNVNGPVSSVRISSDGSTAAFVPAQRALVWQTTDDNGNPIVRERVWVTFQPGEVRTCAGCHGQNDKNQAGAPIPQTKPEALRDLLRLWKTLPK
jgi:cytochrome c553